MYIEEKPKQVSASTSEARDTKRQTEVFLSLIKLHFGNHRLNHGG